MIKIAPEPLDTRRTESVAAAEDASSTPEPLVPFPWAYPVGLLSVAEAPPARVMFPLVVKNSTKLPTLIAPVPLKSAFDQSVIGPFTEVYTFLVPVTPAEQTTS